MNKSRTFYQYRCHLVMSGLSKFMHLMIFMCTFVLAFYMDGRWATTVTTSIFVGAAITDWLDGYLARKVCFC